MNFKNFKKVHEDDHSAVMQTNKGHSIIIAKSALSDKHRKELKDLPMHAADGLKVPEQSMGDRMKQTMETGHVDPAPAPSPVDQPEPQQPQAGNMDWPAAAAPAAAPVQSAPAEQAPMAAAPIDAGAHAADAGTPPATPQQTPEQQQYAGSYQKEYQKNIDHFAQQDVAFAQDLQNGHITPKTYHDLYASQGTIGKIGTLFGLLVSGAGSGLAHQPNAVLEMMNKEIDRDLEAQKQSKENALNFLRVNQANEMNKAQIGKVGAETKGIGIDNQIKAFTKTKNQMMLGLIQSLQNTTDKLPDGPTKAAAMSVLPGVKQAAAAHMAVSNQQASQQLAKIAEDKYVKETATYRTMGLLGQEGAEGMAKTREEHYIPGVGTTDKAVTHEDSQRVVSMRNFQNLLKEAENLGKELGPIGAWTPSQRARAARVHNDLVSSYNDVKGLKRFTGNEEALYDKIIPNMGKVNLTGSQNDLLQDVKKSVQKKMDLEYSSLGIHPFGEHPPTPQFEEGHKGMHSNGKPVVFKNGKWTFQ